MTLERIRSVAAPDLYPRHLLEGCESALVLFAAAWHGRQDAVWIADAGLTGTCVDSDFVKLAEMQSAYPDGWEFFQYDVFELTTIFQGQRQWDVVSIDCPSNLFDKCAEWLPTWCLLARRAVILGTGKRTVVVPPAGWRVTEQRTRSSFLGGVYWTVFEPC